MTIREHFKAACIAILAAPAMVLAQADMPPVNDLPNPYMLPNRATLKCLLDGNGGLPAQSMFTQMARVFGLLSAVAATSMHASSALIQT